ncbi:hypothetical protein OQ477_06380 [Bacillus sp. ChL18]|uniref:hypothetical protein n=1 Tax=Bacillus TaxID=1386 RepID=UPI000206EE73|nr:MULTISPECIES: hypothetical protein [Bacillus]AEB63828.1 hypothetical protein LL3_02292 [Bacillus amyloliquefaciens LL3]MCA1233294.1 hypothetical protein [Bacillus velezensis]MCA1311394.1 hypothetical protein [Bacillus velezensis]MCA1330369.1 hypothetical protein [Bacillus velezensis]MCX2809618.1 hypothetical protein [Bacillus sp. ChL18]
MSENYKDPRQVALELVKKASDQIRYTNDDEFTFEVVNKLEEIEDMLKKDIDKDKLVERVSLA